MSFQSRIPSPSKPATCAQGNERPTAVKRLQPVQPQTKLKLDSSNVTKPVATTADVNPSRAGTARAAKTITNTPSRNLAVHTRGASTSAVIKPSLSTHASKEKQASQIPGASLTQMQSSSSAQQHKRTLSAHASIRATAPSQGSSLPKSRPVGRVMKDSENAPTTNVSALTRPNFDSYKQHFSPQKAKQPVSTTTSRVVVNPSGSTVVASESSRLSDELLQLSLLHTGSTVALQSYEKSIKSHFQSHHADLDRQRQQIESLERDRRARDNLRGLRRWIDENSSGGEEDFDPLSVLAECLQELDEINKDQGAFAVARRQFSDWETNVSSITLNRVEPEGDTTLNFVVPLGSEWSHAIELIERRLKICMNTLRVFDGRHEGATIGEMIAMFSMHCEHLLQEISICRTLERLILQRQQQWIDESIGKALMTVEDKGLQAHQMIPRRGIWEDLQDRH
ncbi:hypothetical protein LTR84_002213 [Exophiala bonariae]|uniref:Uncharacterized protein n=1 Tax=Exophiala bonariae TaxID=1690606 RepID=A0AAV9NDA8_9EURO|nr:hypothetical protein LTR84_002213 [Exophiala bonariae]